MPADDPRVLPDERLAEIRARLAARYDTTGVGVWTMSNGDLGADARFDIPNLLAHIDAQAEALRAERARWHEILEAAEAMALAIQACHLSVPDGDFYRIMQAYGAWRALAGPAGGST